LEEFKSVFVNEKIKDDDWKQIIKEADDNGDGEVKNILPFNNFLKNNRFHTLNSKI